VTNPTSREAACVCRGAVELAEVQAPARPFRSGKLAVIVVFAAAIASIQALTACAPRDTWSLAEGQHPQRYHRIVTQTLEGDFLLYLPAGFHAHSERKYPLLIFLHGSGESGHDLEAVKAQGPPKIVESRPDFPFIMASPQASESWRGFDPVALNAMLDELIVRLPIDTARIYLTGLSMGGQGIYAWASQNPERFAAIAPVSGWGNPQGACRLKHIPVWAFHGAKDDVVPLLRDQAMVDAINECGGNAKMTIYPNVGHDAWTPAYANPDLFSWLLAQRRTPGRQ
jgi:predicted peptidase